MNEVIQSAAELDALPRTVVLLDRMGDPWMTLDGIQWSSPETRAVTSGQLVRKWGPLTVLYRPDRPAQPTVLPAVETLALHLQEYWARSARRREPIIWADLARDTLALIGGRTEREVLAQGWDEGAEFMDSDHFWHDNARACNPYRSEADHA